MPWCSQNLPRGLGWIFRWKPPGGSPEVSMVPDSCWWQPEIRWSPVEVGSWNPIIYKVLAPSQVGFLAGFLNHQQYVSAKWWWYGEVGYWTGNRITYENYVNMLIYIHIYLFGLYMVICVSIYAYTLVHTLYNILCCNPLDNCLPSSWNI